MNFFKREVLQQMVKPQVYKPGEVHFQAMNENYQIFSNNKNFISTLNISGHQNRLLALHFNYRSVIYHDSPLLLMWVTQGGNRYSLTIPEKYAFSVTLSIEKVYPVFQSMMIQLAKFASLTHEMKDEHAVFLPKRTEYCLSILQQAEWMFRGLLQTRPITEDDVIQQFRIFNNQLDEVIMKWIEIMPGVRYHQSGNDSASFLQEAKCGA